MFVQRGGDVGEGGPEEFGDLGESGGGFFGDVGREGGVEGADSGALLVSFSLSFSLFLFSLSLFIFFLFASFYLGLGRVVYMECWVGKYRCKEKILHRISMWGYLSQYNKYKKRNTSSCSTP